MLFKNTFLCIWGDIFGLTFLEILQNIKYVQYFDRSKIKRDMTELKLVVDFTLQNNSLNVDSR